MLGRGSFSLPEVARAALVLDLAAAGVTAEMADVPFDWFAKPAAAKTPPVPLMREGEAARVAPLMPRAAEAPSASTPVDKFGGNPLASPVDNRGGKVLEPKPQAKTDVWVAGEPGGLVVVLQGSGPLEGRALDLFFKMLAAAGYAEELGWVGAPGATSPQALQAAVKGLQPRKVLLLGQNILASWLGKSLGVEGWQASSSGLPGCEGLAVGVTYPPELLLAQPLFKRLAWQHLLKWKKTWEMAA